MTMTVDSPGTVVAALADLDMFRGLRGRQRDEAYMAVEREVRRLHAVQAAMLTEVDQSCSFLDDYHHTPAAWLRAVTNSGKATATTTVQTAAMLAALPLVAAADATGSVGPDQLRLLTRLHGNERCRSRLPDSEELLLGYAKSLTLHEFRQACQRWQAHADPDGAHRDHELSRRNRHVSTSRLGAGGVLHAEGDALTHEIITEILTRHAEVEFEIDLAERLARYGQAAAQYPLARNARQRLYDALLAICLKAAGTTATTTQVPLVNIICTETVLADAIREFFGTPGDPARPSTSQRLRLCETAAGAPVDPHDLVIAALIGQVRRVVVDSAGRVIDLGRRSRLFVGAAREAVLLTGDRCCHPGCEMRVPRIQIDHIDAWATRGGSTNPFNGDPECGKHNRDKQHGRFTVKRDHTGWHHYRPDGTEIAPRGT